MGVRHLRFGVVLGVLAVAWLSSTSQRATTSPNRLALLMSPVPMPPQPMSAMPGRSFGEVTAGACCCAASSSRWTNHKGSPVAAAIVAQSLTNVRREIWMVLDTETLNAKDGRGATPPRPRTTRAADNTSRGQHGQHGLVRIA